MKKFGPQLQKVKEIFNEGQFKHIGLFEEEFQEKYYENLASQFFYLQNDISKILMPYVVKIESTLKHKTKTSDIQKAINVINRERLHYLEDTWEKYTLQPEKVGNKNSHDIFIHLLYAYRVVRNIIMHGQSRFLGYFFDFEKDSKLTKAKLFNDLFTKETFKKYFSLCRQKKAFVMDDYGSLSYLAILLIIIMFFNHKKTYTKIFADIDYLLFTFRSRTNITSKEKFWKALGLKEQWIKKLI